MMANKVVGVAVFGSVILGTLGSMVFAVNGDMGGGDGSEASPWLIEDLADFHEFAGSSTYWDDNIRLETDINLIGVTYTKAVIAPDPYSWSGHSGTPFTGVFDGNGHTISNLTIVTVGEVNDYLGLFGLIEGKNTWIKDLGLVNVNITSGEDSYFIGSLCGEILEGHIINCYCTGSARGDSVLGGLCGKNTNGIIRNCYSTGSVTGVDNYSSKLGSLCGENNNGSIYNCYATGSVTGSDNSLFLGGLCGQNLGGSITNCYSTGLVTSGRIDPRFGGLCGYNSGCMSNCYFLNTAGPNNGIGTPLTYSEMRQQSNFIGWDFVNETSNGTSSWWTINPGEYPSLFNFDPMFVPHVFVGQGTEQDPYLICDPNDLGAIYQQPDRQYRLQNDLDLAEISWSMAVIPDFSGAFDGNSHTVSNLNISGGKYLGLMGISRSSASVTNLGLENVTITGGDNSDYLGGICGDSSGQISNCYVSGSVTGGYRSLFLGGLCGRKYASISNCLTNVSINGGNQTEYLGGLCGASYEGSISNCYSFGSVIAGDNSRFLAGLCGANVSGVTISYCYSTCSVTSGNNSYDLGGLCGWNSGSISNCYSTSSVTGGDNTQRLGGLCGLNSDRSSSCISYCYSTGSVNSGDNSDYLGGLIGAGVGGVISSYWNTESSGQAVSAGGRGRTAAQMKSASTFVGWGCQSTWTIYEGTDYPKLWWENATGVLIMDPFYYAGGTGDPNDPYMIETAQQLNTIGLVVCDWDKHFRVIADIDLSQYTGTEFNLIGINSDYPFTGIFDGNDNVISNLTLDVVGSDSIIDVTSTGCDYIGLFGWISGTDAEIKNLGIENVYITGARYSGYYGSLCGYNFYGNISNCHVTGTIVVSGGGIGGLCGYNVEGDINNCSAAVSISGGGGIGGLCGWNAGNITNCYATGSVTGGYDCDKIGGLCGTNGDTISNCYANVAVAGGDYSRYIAGLCGFNMRKIINCYVAGSVTGGINSNQLGGLCVCEENDFCAKNSYFLDTAGPDNGYGEPLADPNMRIQNSFIGWDFVGDVNGTEDHWQMCIDGYDYPRLTWQFINPADFLHPGRVDNCDLMVLTHDWLSENSRCCDIAPTPDGDDIVNLLDYVEFSTYWLEE